SGRWSKFIWSGFNRQCRAKCPSPRPSPRKRGEGERSTSPLPACGERARVRGNFPMIGRLNHVAIVVPDLTAASATYRHTLGARVSEPCALPAHGVTVVFVE